MVQPGAPGGGEVGVQALVYQRVHEPEPATTGHLVEQARRDGFFERAQHLEPRVSFETEHTLERGELELDPDDGGGLQDASRLRTQAVDAAPDDVADAGGKQRRAGSKLLR